MSRWLVQFLRHEGGSAQDPRLRTDAGGWAYLGLIAQNRGVAVNDIVSLAAAMPKLGFVIVFQRALSDSKVCR